MGAHGALCLRCARAVHKVCTVPYPNCIVVPNITNNEPKEHRVDWCHHSYTKAGSEKQSLLSRSASASVRRHLENHAARFETLSYH